MLRLTGEHVAPAVTEALAQRTGGNPFFVEELVRVMDAGDGRLDVDAAAVPRTVAELLRRRAEARGWLKDQARMAPRDKAPRL